MKDGPLGNLEDEVLTVIKESNRQPCFIAFVDLCNHFIPKHFENADPIENFQIWKDNEINVAFDSYFKKGDDYEFSYVINLPNEKLFYSYGFYIDNNPYSMAYLIVSFNKILFTSEKYEICKKIFCFPQSIEFIFEDPEIKVANIHMLVTNKIDQGILNALRLTFAKNFTSNALHYLENGIMLDYNSELLSHIYLRDCAIKKLLSIDISFVY